MTKLWLTYTDKNILQKNEAIISDLKKRYSIVDDDVISVVTKEYVHANGHSSSDTFSKIEQALSSFQRNDILYPMGPFTFIAACSYYFLRDVSSFRCVKVERDGLPTIVTITRHIP